MLLATPISAQTVQLTDIDGHWGKAAIEWGLQKEMVKGYDNGTFQPNKTVTEAEFLAMVLQFFPNSKEQIQILNQEGRSKSHWSDDFYEVAKQFNLPFNSQRDRAINRGQVARLISATMGKNFADSDDAVRYLLVNQLSKGKKSPTVEGYEPSSNLTRAEALQFLRNIYIAKGGNLGEMKDNPSSEIDSYEVRKQYQEFLGSDFPKGIDGKLKSASKAVVPPKGYSQEEFEKLTTEAYQLMKQTVVSNGKVKVFLPKPTKENELVIVSSYDRTNGDEKQYFAPWKKPVPTTAEYTIDNAFMISVCLTKDAESGYVPVVVATYNSAKKTIQVNGMIVEQNVTF